MWISFSILAAFFVATKDAFSKQAANGANKYVTVFAMNFLTIFIMLVIAYGTGLLKIDFSSIKINFWWSMPIGVIINTLALVFYFESLNKAPLSVVIPLLAFIPIFSIPVSYVAHTIFGFGTNNINIFGIIGVIVIFIGAYLLQIQDIKDKGILFPIKYLFQNKGCLLMLVVSFLWACSAVFDGIAVDNSTSDTYLFIMSIATSVILALILLFKSRTINTMLELKQHSVPLLGIAFFNMLGMIFYLLAIDMDTEVAYVLAIRSLNLLIASIFGFLFFKETGLKEKTIGTTIMVIGIIIIALQHSLPLTTGVCIN